MNSFVIIVWRGKGLVALIPLLGLPILGVIVGTLLMDCQRKIAKVLPFFDDQAAGFAVLLLMVSGCFCGGLICYLFGRRWKREGGYHDVYFMPIDLLGLLASVGSGGVMLLIAGLVVVGQAMKLFR